MNMINGNTYRFNDVRLIVSEGIYNTNIVDVGIKVMEQKALGNLVYYQVIDTEGKIDLEKTFDVAEYWKDHINFDELILDYDEYNADGSLTGQIGLLMPTVPISYEVSFSQKISSVFNNTSQSKEELIEIVS